MRRIIPAFTLLLTAAAFLIASGASTAATSSCSDSWGSDGHSGPWYVGSNQSLHGNTLNISCPSGSTAWSVRYQVGKESTDGSFYYPIDVTRTGNGPTSWNVSRSPIGCNQAPWIYWTHVHNNVTGGDIQKPVSGESIC